MGAIEDIVLRGDRRGIAELRGSVPEDFCTQAAQFVLDHPGKVLIATGFYILSAGAPETDGPPGAIVLGQAIESLGSHVAYVTDAHTAPIMTAGGVAEGNVFTFPILDWEESQNRAARILEDVQPDLLIAIERCGRTRNGEYLNMRGQDISEWTGKLDALFMNHGATIGIGDGGNEVGMGTLYDVIPSVSTLVQDPCDVAATHLVLAAVSNWGGYGVVAALSRLTGKRLLPSTTNHARMIRKMAQEGAVDGTTGAQEPVVDGFTLEENMQVLTDLRALER